MTETTRTLFVCSCEGTMPLDLGAIQAAHPDAEIIAGRQLCMSEAARVEAKAKSPSLTIACTYQAPLFAQLLEDIGRTAPATYVDIREMAGWSAEADKAGPKMAALLAAAQEPVEPPAQVTLESEGVALLLGRDETVLSVAERLKDVLDITVLIAGAEAITPGVSLEYPVFHGKVRTATGVLGSFALTVDEFAAPAPSSRGALRFGPGRDGATSECHIIVDLTGGAPLFAADDLRPGYLRSDPASTTAVDAIISQARDLVGTFDKPRYVNFRADLCAHSRSRITGCTRCLEICPTGAITPAGDAVSIDAAICAGCGGCSAVCPTGAATYALPPPDAGLRRIRALLAAYHQAGGTNAAVLLHDRAHGLPLLHALSHHGAGLPAHVLPLEIEEATQLGIEWFAAALAYGAAEVMVLTRAKPKHDDAALVQTLSFIGAMLPDLGLAGAVRRISTDDPDELAAALSAHGTAAPGRRHASFLPLGGKREVQRRALRELRAVAPAQPERIALPAGAPMGRIVVETEGCTLCHACVSACPTQALQANPDRPELRFAEDLCVQCGICAGTCPEKVITLEPRLDFLAIDAAPILLKQEEPHECERCGKPFGTRSTIARIREKLGGKHWMFSGANADRLALIGLCDDCRVNASLGAGIDPYAGPERPRVRTSDDYFAERKTDRDDT